MTKQCKNTNENLAKPSGANAGEGGLALQRKECPGDLPANLQVGLESMSGKDMSDVTVNYNSSTPGGYGAHAITQGNRIDIAPGQEQHLPHEAWHVVQQKQGRVPVTGSMGGTPVNTDTSLEKEADVMGARAMQMKTVTIPNILQSSTVGSTAQLKTTLQYGPLTDFTYSPSAHIYVTGRVGTWANATLDPKDPKKGTDTTSSDAFSDLFDELQQNTNSTWARGHLINHDLGGVAFYNNLFPITTAANGEHKDEVEKHVKHWIAAGKNVQYNVTAKQDNNNGDGTFDCSAWILNRWGLEDKTKPAIHKEIKSSTVQIASTQKYANKSENKTNKYSAINHLSGNRNLRDQFPLGQNTLDTWEHETGKAGINNQGFDYSVEASRDKKGNLQSDKLTKSMEITNLLRKHGNLIPPAIVTALIASAYWLI